jgi:hypothetical protein
MDADADRQLYPWVLCQTGIEPSQRLHHVEASPHGPLGVVFMRLGIPKVHQQTIPKVLCDMAIKALDDRSGGLLVGPYHRAPIFRVELASEERRVNEITEHHRELAPFGIWRATLNVDEWRLWALVVSGRRL